MIVASSPGFCDGARPSIAYQMIVTTSQDSEKDRSLPGSETTIKDETWFETLRTTEYDYLDQQKHTYLDYTGAGLASKWQFQALQKRLAGELCGNPHSQSPSSLAATRLVEQTRARVLEHFNADPKEYAVIFTANATAAAKLIGESYAFNPLRRLVLTYDNHNSVNGLREYAKRRKCRTVYVPCGFPDLTIDVRRLKKALRPRGAVLSCSSPGLFAYPAQSNFSGVRHSLEYVNLAQSRGFDVLLDAAAFVPTNELDLAQIKPEFVIVSWYKMFGFPTGVGCLLARRSALTRLKRPWFSGGTIEAVSVGIPWHRMTRDESAFEDGTLNFHGIPDVACGLDWIDSIGVSNIHCHIESLVSRTLNKLSALKHSSGLPMCIVYGPKAIKQRGSTVAFNLLDTEGKVVDERIVGKEAADANISLRTGCFCNPGVGENLFQLHTKHLRSLLWSRSPTIDEYIRLLKLPSAGAIRISFGVASSMEDVNTFISFVEKTYRDRLTSSEGLPPRERC